jgi:protein TonB
MERHPVGLAYHTASARTRLSEADLDQAITSLVDAQRPWSRSRRHGRRLGPVLLISLWLHLTLLLLLVVNARHDRQKEGLPPPATVELVFEGEPGAPASAEPTTPAPTPPPIPPTGLVVPQPQVPTPIEPPVPAPLVAIAPPPTPPPVPAPAPLPVPPVPARPPATVEIPPPLPPLAMVVPRLPPPTPRTPPRSIAPAHPEAFPTPMNLSLNQPTPPAHAPERRKPGGSATLDISLTMRQGDTGTTPDARPGSDWGNELVAWVNRHKYYPTQAAMNGEDGNVTVQVVANPNGHVTAVEMKWRSGSQWLDMALMGLFRDANLPPLHDATEPITFNFTMHYILIRAQ